MPVSTVKVVAYRCRAFAKAQRSNLYRLRHGVAHCIAMYMQITCLTIMSEKSIDVLIALMHNVHYLTDDYYVYQSFRRMHWMCSIHVFMVQTHS